MSTRIGIELSPVACRIVEIAAPAGRRRAGGAVQVRSYALSPRLGGDAVALIARFRGRQASVVVWGLRGDYRQTVVRASKYDAMRREAINSLRSAGIDTRGVLTDIAPAGPRREEDGRRPVVMALASRNDVVTALRPLAEAGLRIRSVQTPATALASLARLRRELAPSGGVQAYVALEETTTCVALMRDHALVAARELPWGYLYEHEPEREAIPCEEIAGRLGTDLQDFFSTAGVASRLVSAVHVCGGLPELRTMTALMVERLDIEIEPMDSMFGIDTSQLPAPAEEFRDHGAELRLAWAVAADWTAPLNLLRDRQRQAASTMFARAAVVAGVGAGVGLGWGIQKSLRWEQLIESRAPVEATHSRPDARSVRPATSDRAFTSPPAITSPAPTAVMLAEPARQAVESPQEAPSAALAPGSVSPVAALPSLPPAIARVRTTREPDLKERRPIDRRRPAVRPSAEAAVPRPALELGTILYGPDRKLAMIDGRIVEAGDEVNGSIVVEIDRTSVTLRDGAGRLSRLFLGSKRSAPER